MCITVGPARLSKTVIYTGHAILNAQRVAVLAYQNEARSHGPNAMVLPIPTNSGIGPDNMVDTTNGGWFLRALDEATEPDSFSMSRGLVLGSMIGAKAAQVFDKGSYTVVLAMDVSQIQEALLEVPAHKRPTISQAFLDGYRALYPGWPVAVMCWEGNLKSEPIMWWYRPRDERLFIPTMDAHDGGPPVPGQVAVDHKLLWGTDAGHSLRGLLGRHLPHQIDRLLSPMLASQTLSGSRQNGDTWIEDGAPTRYAL